MTEVVDWKRRAEMLQDDKNEQYAEIQSLKKLVKVLVAFIFDRDKGWLNYKSALEEDE